nr:transposon TX1 uncharacterized [Tanacetum cinerariifolium]
MSRPSYTSNLFKRLNVDDSSMLDLPFSIQEIKDAVWSCGGEKAPGPDGFTFKLLKKHWDVFGSDIISYVKEFEATFSIPKGCNSSFIALVPKIDDPLSLNDYRPISLIGCQYKIIAKVLANRLAKVIYPVGLRQGDPLFPFLFILAIEALNVVLEEAKAFFSGHGSGDRIHISHLQFADDAIIMGDWLQINVRTCLEFLRVFTLQPGSKLISIKASFLELVSLTMSSPA